MSEYKEKDAKLMADILMRLSTDGPLGFTVLMTALGYSYEIGEKNFRHVDRALQKLRKRGAIYTKGRMWHIERKLQLEAQHAVCCNPDCSCASW